MLRALLYPLQLHAAALTRPATSDIRRMWCSTVPVTDVLEVANYLRSRGIAPEAVAEQHLARAISPRTWIAPSARVGTRDWRQTGHRLLLQLCNARGECESLLARRVMCPDGLNTLPKSLALRGHERRGLVMADEVGRYLLRWDPPARDDQLDVIVADGEIDWLVWAVRARRHERATFGVVAGAWTQEFADRIPPGAHLTVATHLDAAGDKYAAQIVDTVSRRSDLGGRYRWHPPTLSYQGVS